MGNSHHFLAALVATQRLTAFAVGDTVVAKSVVLTQIGATPAELHAAKDLRDHLAKITGVDIPLRGNATTAPSNCIVVGQGPLARKLLPAVNWGKLGLEQTLIRSKGNALVVAGGRPRGTLYAVYRLLQVKCGVRWWTPWATTIPSNPKLRFGKLDWTETPAFEYRDPFWHHSFDADWAARNFDNGSSTRIDDQRGGRIEYQGFVHTYYGLVPPAQYFAAHPEWYSLIDGKRTYDNAQLCTTNPALRDFVVEQVRAQLRANPKARIVSVSQNDCFNPCQCPDCRALAQREGSGAALVLDLANYVAEKIEKEFPNVAVDTLAYQWSRHPTKTMKPRPNVIVRLCSIECNFAYPLSAPQNASFGDDIRGWSKLTNRLYVWDYCTNFANYLAPHPDYFTLGPTIRFFSEHGVKGVFEEGDYTSNGGDMAELKAWLIGQLLWNPKQDHEKLIDEFLAGYYGPAAPSIRSYLDLMANEAKAWNLTFASSVKASFLRYEVMDKAYELWQRAMQQATKQGADPKYAWRVLQIYNSIGYVFLSRWQEFKGQAGATLPLSNGIEAEARNWLLAATTDLGGWRKAGSWATIFNRPPEEWAAITAVHEGGLTPAQFAARLTG